MRHHDIAVAPDHPAFAGHFPGAPILPGAVLLDLVLRRVAVDLDWDLGACEIAAAKFLGKVLPGARLHLAYAARADGAIGFTVSEADRALASGVLLPPGLRAAAP